MISRVHFSNILVACGCSFLFSITSFADVEWKFSGQVRTRWEIDRKTFSGSVPANEYGYLRTRLGVMAKVNENVSAFVQLQDSRVIGGSINGSPTSGTTNDAKNADLHQGYFKINHLWEGGPGMKGGRFEVNIGNERFFGGGNWSNVGRSFEGISLFSSSETFVPSLMYLKRVESPGTGFSPTEASLFLLHLSFPKVTTDLLLLADLDNRNTPFSDFLERRYHFGLYTKRNLGSYQIEANGALQMGDLATTTGTDEILAYLITAQFGRVFGATQKGLFALGVDWSSGDEVSTTDRNEQYDDLYFTGHKFRGFIDIFDTPGTGGLFDGYLRLLAPLNAANSVRMHIDAHAFFFSPGSLPANRDFIDDNLGVEFDAVATITSIAGVQLELGGSILLPGNAYLSNSDPAYWGYGAVMVDF